MSTERREVEREILDSQPSVELPARTTKSRERWRDKERERERERESERERQRG